MACAGGEVHTEFWWAAKGKRLLENLNINGRTILKLV
jgi:hypothetical protein